MIRRSDRVADVLRRDEGLIEVLVAASPVFQGLRNPAVRKTMGRLATVEQAARVAGINPDELVERLDRASRARAASPSGEGVDSSGDTLNTEEQEMSVVDAAGPAALARVPADRVVDLDVREDLRNGREPFSRIMAARREVPPGGVLRLRAIFEPVPLYAVMAKQGFDHWTEQLAEDDWRVWFYPRERDPGASRTPDPAAGRLPPEEIGGEEDADVIVLDVRGMEPPEPMVHTLAALEELPEGKTLLQINERVPQFLLPKLEELGFRYEIREQDDELVRVFIRHGSGR